VTRTTETVPAGLDGERIDRVVALVTGLPRTAAADLVASGAVEIGGRPVTTRSRRVATGEVIDVDLPALAEPEPCEPDAEVDIAVVFADEHVIVCDKPAGLVTHPGAGNRRGTLVQGLLARFPDLAAVGDPARPGIVHRLDKGTSGLLVVARTRAAYASLTRQLASRTAVREYLALAWGHLDASAGVIDAPVGRAERHRTRMAVSARGRVARTRYEVRTRFSSPVEVTLVSCRLETGRTHQIRVHLAAVGHPVVGDTRYGGARRSLAPGRPFLHAERLSFDHPATGERLVFESALPAELAEVLAGLT